MSLRSRFLARLGLGLFCSPLAARHTQDEPKKPKSLALPKDEVLPRTDSSKRGYI